MNNIDGVRIDDYVFVNSDKTKHEDQPILLDLSGGHLEEELNEAINDNNEQRESAADARVPSSLDNSLSDQVHSDTFESLSMSDDSLAEFNQESKYLRLNRVPANTLPFGIIKQDYSHLDKIKLIQLYQSKKNDDLKELFQYIAQNIHHKYRNCIANFGKWLTSSNTGEPMFYRNCIPCTNAVDLNLQSLFHHHLNLDKLKHYFVNTCDAGTEWISYINDMEYLSVDFKRHPTSTFSDVIRQNLVPNQRFSQEFLHCVKREFSIHCRYIFQGIVRSDRGQNHKGYFHACNLINDEHGQIWIIDGQVERVFQLDHVDDRKELDQRYRPDYLSRASTGVFRSLDLI